MLSGVYSMPSSDEKTEYLLTLLLVSVPFFVPSVDLFEASCSLCIFDVFHSHPGDFIGSFPSLASLSGVL